MTYPQSYYIECFFLKTIGGIRPDAFTVPTRINPRFVRRKSRFPLTVIIHILSPLKNDDIAHDYIAPSSLQRVRRSVQLQSLQSHARLQRTRPRSSAKVEQSRANHSLKYTRPARTCGQLLRNE